MKELVLVCLFVYIELRLIAFKTHLPVIITYNVIHVILFTLLILTNDSSFKRHLLNKSDGRVDCLYLMTSVSLFLQIMTAN